MLQVLDYLKPFFIILLIGDGVLSGLKYIKVLRIHVNQTEGSSCNLQITDNNQRVKYQNKLSQEELRNLVEN